jgi:UrcA family protein
MRFTLPLIALAALAAPAVSANETVEVRIAYGDVDVTTPEGRAAIEARIAAKARKACAVPAASRYTYGRPALDSQCIADARNAALAEVERIAAAKAGAGRAVAAN